jgi:hypothetical protein
MVFLEILDFDFFFLFPCLVFDWLLLLTQRTPIDTRVISIRAKCTQDPAKTKRFVSFGTTQEALVAHILSAIGESRGQLEGRSSRI